MNLKTKAMENHQITATKDEDGLLLVAKLCQKKKSSHKEATFKIPNGPVCECGFSWPEPICREAFFIMPEKAFPCTAPGQWNALPHSFLGI